MRILARPMNRSVVVAGDTGVGKTALVHEVARRIQREECPADLMGHRIVELSPTALQTDIKYLGEWQTKITRLVEEVSDNPGTILYVPRFHHLLGAGATTGHEEDMAGALAPLLESGQLVVIADAPPELLRRMLRTRPEMDRALTVVDLAEPDGPQVKEILTSARAWIRGADGPRIEPAAVDRAIDLCGRFLRHRRFPAKAIDLLRATCESVGEEGGSIVTPEDVAVETSAMTGLPRFLLLDSEPFQIEKARGYFEERVLGQDEALEALLDTIARIKTGLQDPQRPLGTYLFAGPTGVGKTETAKALASFLFGDERRLVRFDMSEYADALAAERLIEARDGRVDSGARGHLTGAVRENPLAVILLDEIEKAHPRVFDLLLQVLGEGRLTDARGETVDFRECVVLMTSNLGAERGGDGGLGFNVDKAAAEAGAIREEVERFFRPEFLNRLDRIVSFHRLNREILHTIALREVGRCLGREGVVRRGVVVDTDPSVADLVLDRGMSSRFGARQLKRAVEELVAVPLARVLSQRVLSVDDTVRLRVEGNQVVAEVVRDDARVSTTSSSTVMGPRRPESIGQIEEDLADVADRIEALDAFLGISDARSHEERLRKEMERPGFWDDTARASAHLRELADINHLLDRQKTVHSHKEEVALLLDLMKDGHRELIPEAGQKVKALGQSIDVMEVETLLTDPLDSRGAFVVVSAGTRDQASRHWAGELVRLYSRWSRRRGLDVRLVAERMPGDAGGRSAIVHVDGRNAYGLLRMETGTHRKVHAPGDVRQVVTARIRVYPEPKLDSVGSDVAAPTFRVARPRDLEFLRRATGIVTLPTHRDPWMLLTDLPEEQALQVMGDLGVGIGEAHEVVDEQAPTIARTFVLDRRRQVRDPRSGHESTDTKTVLDGAIDDFILAGLTMSPESVPAVESVDEAS